MEWNGLVSFTLHHGTVLERSEWLFLASGNGVLVRMVSLVRMASLVRMVSLVRIADLV